MTDTIREERFFTSKVDGFEDRYIVEYAAGKTPGPLVAYLHAGLSHAEQGFCEDSEWCFGALRDEVIRRGGVYLAPEYRGNSWMGAPAEADLAALLVELKLSHKTSKVILAGTSMGGTSALIFASHHADIIAGVIALCPVTDMKKLYRAMDRNEDLMSRHLVKSIVRSYGGTPDANPGEYVHRSSVRQAARLKMPVVIRHGDADRIVPISHSTSLVEKLRIQGTRVRLDVIEGGDHTAPTIDVPWREYLDFVLGVD